MIICGSIMEWSKGYENGRSRKLLTRIYLSVPGLSDIVSHTQNL